MGGDAYDRFWKIIKQEPDYFSVSVYASSGPVCNENFIFLFVLKYPIEGESEGYTVRSKEEIIAISEYPLMQTEFLYDSKKGREINVRLLSWFESH